MHGGRYVAKRVIPFLEALVNRGEVVSPMRTSAKGFNVAIVGHSLGAGTASVLAWLLRPLWPNLLCYAYSAPSVLSADAAENLKSNVVTLVLYKDVVPRLCLANLYRLRDQVIDSLHASDAGKAWVYREAILPWGDTTRLLQANTTVISIPSTAPSTQLIRSESPTHLPMYPPGRIIILERDPVHALQNPNAKGADQDYVTRSADKKEFLDIVVSGCMLYHHLPDVLAKRLAQVAEPLREATWATASAASAGVEDQESTPEPTGVLTKQQGGTTTTLEPCRVGEDITG
mmetsp:Transcript_40739/g.88112  ORF Transcript_40739/g.88112 Transcript_40739/m.88112 type:complete len:288 (-) Transcript_40739:113-976(-)